MVDVGTWSHCTGKALLFNPKFGNLNLFVHMWPHIDLINLALSVSPLEFVWHVHTWRELLVMFIITLSVPCYWKIKPWSSVCCTLHSDVWYYWFVICDITDAMSWFALLCLCIHTKFKVLRYILHLHYGCIWQPGPLIILLNMHNLLSDWVVVCNLNVLLEMEIRKIIPHDQFDCRSCGFGRVNRSIRSVGPACQIHSVCHLLLRHQILLFLNSIGGFYLVILHVTWLLSAIDNHKYWITKALRYLTP